MDSYAIEVLHVVLPLYFLADLLFATRRRGLPWSTSRRSPAIRCVWLVHTMVRGELVVDPAGVTAWWYPYPFLDPHGAGGWAPALMYIAGIFVAFVGIGAGIIAIGRHRERRAARRGDDGTCDRRAARADGIAPAAPLVREEGRGYGEPWTCASRRTRSSRMTKAACCSPTGTRAAVRPGRCPAAASSPAKTRGGGAPRGARGDRLPGQGRRPARHPLPRHPREPPRTGGRHRAAAGAADHLPGEDHRRTAAQRGGRLHRPGGVVHRSSRSRRFSG